MLYLYRPQRAPARLSPSDTSARYFSLPQTGGGDILDLGEFVVNFVVLDVATTLAILVLTLWVAAKAWRKVLVRTRVSPISYKNIETIFFY